MHPLREMLHSLRASPVFAFYLLVTLGVAGFIGVVLFYPRLLIAAFGPEFRVGGFPVGFHSQIHFAEPRHLVHDLTFGFLFTTGVVGILAQLRRPSKKVAGQLMALIPWAGLLLAGVLSTSVPVLGIQWVSVAAVTGITTLLHPTGRAFFRSFSAPRVNWVMLGLVIIAAVPLLVFASTNIRLQATVLDDHARTGHYGFMAAFGFTVIGVGLLASLRPDGWRLTAWVAGLLPALLGVSSVMFPDASSSLGLVWALAAIAWGAGFVAAAELTQDAKGPTLLGSRDLVSKSERG